MKRIKKFFEIQIPLWFLVLCGLILLLAYINGYMQNYFQKGRRRIWFYRV